MARTVVYWLAVLAVSLGLVFGLILFLDSRDRGALEEAARPTGGGLVSCA